MGDIKMSGMFFTWIQLRKDPGVGILKKLDSIMGNDIFMIMFPDSYVKFLHFLISDHTPAILIIPFNGS